MLNITVLSLTLSSIHSISPLFVGNRNHFQQFSMKTFISSIFINPDQLLLEKSSFDHGIGSLVYSNRHYSHLNEEIPDFIGKTFNNDNIVSYKSPEGQKALITVQDCLFLSIQTPNDNGDLNCIFNITNTYTFYMTSCLFDKCSSERPIIFLASRATTISHICCSDLTGKEQNDVLFLRTDTPEGSFFKFIYSTIFGDNEYVKVRGVCELGGRAALRYQCINMSNFVFDPKAGFITRIYASRCITMLMNTFANTNTQYILSMNIQDGASNERYNHYCGLSNFYQNKQQDSIIYLDMNNEVNAIIDQCYFSNDVDDNGEKIKKSNKNTKIMISNCVFKTFLQTSELIGYETKDCINSYDLPPHTLAHYTYEGKCRADFVINAFGCQNDTCPNGDGCQTFGFTEDDVVYTEKFHPDINTPTRSPTAGFSRSYLFTFSEEFTFSNAFSKSILFSNSDRFSQSVGFTNSKKFSETRKFTESSDFSDSTFFSSSLAFTRSGYFSGTDGFSKTFQFSKTDEFSKTGAFSRSTQFTKSGDFTESKDFTRSGYFSGTDDFSKTGQFSKTGAFSRSTQFTKSGDFTESADFLPTIDFNHTSGFSPSKTFTRSIYFSGSDDFSKSEDFTKTGQFSDSTDFSHSIVFTKSNLFSQSTAFSTSNPFSKSTAFSTSYLFSESVDFSDSGFFSKTSLFSDSSEFTKTNDFSNSHKFLPSSEFSKSVAFSDSEFFSQTNLFSESFDFSKSDAFHPSKVFTESSTFTSSNLFTPSNTAVKLNSKQFSMSDVFSKSFEFTQSAVARGIVPVKSDDGKKLGAGAIAGIVAGIVAALLIIILLIIFWIRRKKTNIEEEDVETLDELQATTNTDNPIYDNKAEDDPFKDDFND